MLFIITILITFSTCFAQSFPPDSVWTFAFDDGGDEYFYDAVEVSDGFLLCGEARAWNALAGEALLVKIDLNGELVWERRYPHARHRRFTKLPSTGRAWGDHVSINGQTIGAFRMHYDSIGIETYLEDFNESPQPLFSIGDARTTYPDDDEGYTVIYTRRNSGVSENSIFRFVCCGTVSNTLLASGPGDFARDEDIFFDFAVCGETNNSTDSGRDGLMVWRRYPDEPVDSLHRAEIGGVSDDWFNAITGRPVPTPYVVCGGSRSFTNGSSDLWTVGVQEDGTIDWSRHYGGLAYEDGVELVEADDDGFIIAGNFSSEDVFFEQSDFWLLKVDLNGDSVWSRLVGGDEADRCEGMIQTENGFLLIGSSQSFAVPGWDGCAMLLSYVPDIAATPASLNFGPVGVGDSAARMVGLINTGSNVLTVSEILGTENYSANFSEPQSVAIGETLRVEIVFAPQTSGTHIDTLRVISDAISGAKIVRCLGAGTAVNADDAQFLPREFRLHPPYPNPFNPTATMNFDLPRNATVELTVFDVQGRVVERLVNENLSAGTHSRDWTCATCAGGVYFARLRTSEFVGIQKLLLVK